MIILIALFSLLLVFFVWQMIINDGFVVGVAANAKDDNNNSIGLNVNKDPFLFFFSPSKSTEELQSRSLSSPLKQPTPPPAILQPSSSQSLLQSSSANSQYTQSSPSSSSQLLSLPPLPPPKLLQQQPSSSKLSPWFPSVPASACKGIFEFRIDGTAYLNHQHFKNANDNVTLQITSTNGNSIAGRLWIDKKGYDDKGIDFNINNISNNCKNVIFSQQ